MLYKASILQKPEKNCELNTEAERWNAKHPGKTHSSGDITVLKFQDSKGVLKWSIDTIFGIDSLVNP